ncbi:MAG: tRNA (5-methylaminomethyl-2-thiouridine)(34)-methyltransferase MnmD [Bacteroidota bacterium]
MSSPDTIQITSDGSQTVRSGRFDIQYHSIHGAVTESEHVFINAGLHARLERGHSASIHIVEMGFGTGLNAYLALREAAARTDIKFSYSVVEKYPLDKALISQLEYAAILGLPRVDFQQLHESDWDAEYQLSDNFTLHKVLGDWLEVAPGLPKADVIFYDAFAPNAQPELWSEESMQSCADLLQPGGCWVSYCAKGSVKRALKAAGLQVEAIPGPPRKREMTRAWKMDQM